MAPSRDYPYKPADQLVAIQPSTDLTVQPPSSGVIGRFLEETANMFRARAMRMIGLQRRINEAGQRTESMLRTAAGLMEAAESRLEQDLRKEGLLPGTGNGNALEDSQQ